MSWIEPVRHAEDLAGKRRAVERDLHERPDGRPFHRHGEGRDSPQFLETILETPATRGAGGGASLEHSRFPVTAAAGESTSATISEQRARAASVSEKDVTTILDRRRKMNRVCGQASARRSETCAPNSTLTANVLG
jgi:hypothetical protein